MLMISEIPVLAGQNGAAAVPKMAVSGVVGVGLRSPSVLAAGNILSLANSAICL